MRTAATEPQGTQRAGRTLPSLLCALFISTASFGEAAGRPDRTLYYNAKAALAALQKSSALQKRRSEWEKVILRYRKVVARYPQSPYCDDALLAVGDLYRDMAKRFRTTRYHDDAVKAYQTLVREYPSSSLGEQALYNAFEIARTSRDRRRAREAAKAYLEAFPDAKRASQVKAGVMKSVPPQEADLPKAPPKGLAALFNLRSWSGERSTRVVLDLERQVPIRHDRIGSPDRLWIDLQGTRLHPNLKDRSFPVGDGLLDQVRLGQNRDDVVRVVLDFKDVDEHTIFYLQDPPRLVVDVKGAPQPQVAASTKDESTPAGDAVPTPSPAPPRAVVLATPGPTSASSEPGRLPTRRVAGLAPPDGASAPPEPRPVTVTATPPPGPRSARLEGPAPQPPQVNRTGSYSIARQLGLGARTIVIDAGHGGHDPGTIGRGGLQEKDLVLDVALRLARLVRSELSGAEVVMTRSTDVFIPLEERTAIANSKGADLFLSIHANSSRNSRARGIETYFLNFAKNPHAEEVAARENSISAATLKDLQGLVKAITLNSKIDESRDFAASVQEAMVESLRPHHPDLRDRGVHAAPFYVLIGANMPSVLAEIAFVSHPEEERLLRRNDFRDKVARSLLAGVRRYLDALNRTQTRQLTSRSSGATVASRSGRR